jgi:hypothetical protein
MLPAWALQQVGSYLGYSGPAVNVVARAALDLVADVPQQSESHLKCGRSLARLWSGQEILERIVEQQNFTSCIHALSLAGSPA